MKIKLRETLFWLPLIVVSMGVVLEATWGQTFIANFSSFHQDHTLLTVLFCVIVMGWPAIRVSKIDIASHRSRLTTGLRFLLTLPFALSVLVLALVVAIYGWSAAFGRSIGSWNTNIPMTIKTYQERPPSTTRSKPCLRRADVKHASDEAKICLDGMYTGEPLPVGQQILVDGQVSFFGISVQALRPVSLQQVK